MNDEFISPIELEEVLKTLEYYGIYQEFGCVKCKLRFGSINLAMCHLRADCIPSKNYIPKKPPVFISSKKHKKKTRDKRTNYTEEERKYILSSGQGNKYLAERFNTTPNNISKVKFRWKKLLKPNELKELKKERVTNQYKYQKNASTDYKVESADEK